MSFYQIALRRRWQIAASGAFFCVAAAVLAFVMSPYWRIEIVVRPVDRHAPSFLSSTVSPFEGLSASSALSGLTGNSPSSEAIAILESREIFDEYALRENLLPELFSSKWDARLKRWKVSPEKAPTLRTAFTLFQKSIRDIEENRRYGTVTLSLTWKNREAAVKWATDLIRLVNAKTRQRTLSEVDQNIEYLQAQIHKTSDVASLSALTRAYEKQLELAMFARGNEEYALQVIDPPTIPDYREMVRPNRPLIIFTGLFFGILVGYGAAIVWEWVAFSRKAKKQ